jgi:Protein of unknown function DUF262
MALLNRIHNDHTLVLPDIQRDFVWDRDQIRLLFDSLLKGYPFGALLIWETRYLDVAYRDFVVEYSPGVAIVPKLKDKGRALEMVLDGQQRLQSFLIGVYGSHEGRRLYFDVTSGPSSEAIDDDDEGDAGTFRFAFWREQDANRPRRYVLVSEVVALAPRVEDQEISRLIAQIPLEGDIAALAASNMRRLRAVMQQSDLVPVEYIDRDAPNESAARTIDEVLDIFVRVNTGGTRLSRSDLMFSIIKRHWSTARINFDELVAEVERTTPLGIDKDFIIRGLLTVADAPPSYEVENIKRNWAAIEQVFDVFARSLRNSIDFIRSPDVGILSASLLDPVATLFPLIYYVSQQAGQSVPDGQRQALRTLLYFLLFNEFLHRPEARIRYLRDRLKTSRGGPLPLDSLLRVIQQRQRWHYVTTTSDMLSARPVLALNLVQPQVRKATMSWQERPEVDHIFPRAKYALSHPHLINDIGNLAFLGKLRNIRKSDAEPWDYFRDVPAEELLGDYLIDKSLLREGGFEAFVEDRRQRILQRVRDLLGR